MKKVEEITKFVKKKLKKSNKNSEMAFHAAVIDDSTEAKHKVTFHDGEISAIEEILNFIEEKQDAQ